MNDSESKQINLYNCLIVKILDTSSMLTWRHSALNKKWLTYPTENQRSPSCIFLPLAISNPSTHAKKSSITSTLAVTLTLAQFIMGPRERKIPSHSSRKTMARESLEISAKTSLNKTSETPGGSFVLGLIPPHLHRGKTPIPRNKIITHFSNQTPPNSQTFKASQTVVEPSPPKKKHQKIHPKSQEKMPGSHIPSRDSKKETRGSQLSAMIFKSKVKALKPQSEASKMAPKTQEGLGI